MTHSIRRFRNRQGAERLPVADGAEVHRLPLEDQGEEGHERVQRHHEDDAHDVPLPRTSTLR